MHVSYDYTDEGLFEIKAGILPSYSTIYTATNEKLEKAAEEIVEDVKMSVNLAFE
jgi:hypothetical protein